MQCFFEEKYYNISFVVIFLCKNKNANLTEIGEYLDYAKDYDENHIRQYRYKINTIIGKDIIEAISLIVGAR